MHIFVNEIAILTDLVKHYSDEPDESRILYIDADLGVDNSCLC